MTNKKRQRASFARARYAALLMTTALVVPSLSTGAAAQSPGAQQLPSVSVQAPRQRAARPRPAPRRQIAGARAPRVVQAPPVAPQPRQQGERGNGPVNGIVARQSVTGTKTDTPILETPQSISVVTRDQIAAQGSQTISQAIGYTPGISPDTYGVTTAFDIFKIRGFEAPRYLDGLRLPLDPGSQFAYPRIEPYGLERLEVLRGPSAGLYGQSEPGGIINMVSKRPMDVAHGEVGFSFGSFGRAQGMYDIGGPIDKDGKYLYRFVGLGRASGSQTDFQDDNRVFVAPSFTWQPNADTSLTILGHYQKINNDGYQQYLPGLATMYPSALGRIPLNRYLGEPSIDGYKLEQAAIGYAFQHRFNDFLIFRQNLRYTDVTNSLTGVRGEGLQADNRTLNRSVNYVDSASRNLAIDTSVQADFVTGPLAHKVLVGVDYLNTQSNSDYRFAFGSPIDIYNPVYGGPGAFPTKASLGSFIASDVSQKQLGVYLQDQIKLDRWTLSLTGRQDWAEATSISTGLFPPPGVYRSDDSKMTGRAGLNYLFDNGISPYVNYSTSFTPVTGGDYSGNAFKPITGEGKEIGVKYLAPGSNLLLTAALFDITQKNMLVPSPINPVLSVQTGASRVRGVELEARGNLSRELEIIAQYTHMSSRDVATGNRLANVPEDTASLWGKYSFKDGQFAGLGLGAGVRYVGAASGDAANTFDVKAYTLFDAAISYDFGMARPQWRGWSAQVNILNLADKYYIASCVSSLNYCGPGTSRTVLATLKYAWGGAVQQVDPPARY